MSTGNPANPGRSYLCTRLGLLSLLAVGLYHQSIPQFHVSTHIVQMDSPGQAVIYYHKMKCDVRGLFCSVRQISDLKLASRDENVFNLAFTACIIACR